MNHTIISRMHKVLFLLTIAAVVQVFLIGACGVHDVRADEIQITTSTYKTSQMTAGKDYKLKQDTTIRVDKDVSIGMLTLNRCRLTIEGTKTLTVTGIQSDTTRTTSGDLIFKSGTVKIDSNKALAPSAEKDAGIYLGGTLQMLGGNLYVSIKGPEQYFDGLDVRQLMMSAGIIQVNVQAYAENKATAVNITGNAASAPSEVSGGTLFAIANSKYTGTRSDIGIQISDNGKLTISGGTVQAAGGTTKMNGYGIFGYDPSEIEISGGKAAAYGGACGIYCGKLTIFGNADVIAEATVSNYGYGADARTIALKDYAVLKAKGQKYAVCASTKNGLSIGENQYIKKPENGSLCSNSGGYLHYISVSPSDKDAATEVEIACIKPAEEKPQSSEPKEDSGKAQGTTGGKTDEKTGEKSEEEILKPLRKADAAAVRNPAGPAPISANAIGKLPVNTKITRIKAETIVTQGSLTKKKMTIRYPKVAGATNYIIAWKKAKAKSWTYYTAGNKTSFVIRKLKRKDLLEFKVAAYSKGSIGPWSGISYRYFENAKASLSRKGTKLTVQFKKVKGASGYQLLLADNRKMERSRIKAAKGKTKLSVKKLKRKMKYYVRWRPYKKYKGKKYLGVLKGVKKV